MSDSIQPSQSMWRKLRIWAPWVAFAAGLAVVPAFVVFQVLFGDRKPQTDGNTAPVWILFGLGFCVCCISPFFTSLSRSLKLAIALGGALAFIVILFVGILIIGFVFLPAH